MQSRKTKTPTTTICRTFPYNFLRRHPDLKTSKPHSIDVPRALASCQVALLPFFNLLETLHEKHKYPPSLIFNCDETSLRLSDDCREMVVHPSDLPSGFSLTPTRMPNSTFVMAVAGDGFSFKSIILWPSVRLPPELRPLISAQIDVWVGNNGWMTNEIIKRYCSEILLPSIVQRREILEKKTSRCLLILDCHPSRADPDLWIQFSSANIDVLTLVPHSSHLTQPLDRGVFANFKASLNKRYLVPLESNISLRRAALSDAIPDALRTATMSETIKSSFEAAGILPGTSTTFISKLPVEPPLPPHIRPPSRPFHTSNYRGRLISDPDFLAEWKRSLSAPPIKKAPPMDTSSQTESEDDKSSDRPIIGKYRRIVQDDSNSDDPSNSDGKSSDSPTIPRPQTRSGRIVRKLRKSEFYYHDIPF